MAEKALTFALLARDQASQAFNKVATASDRAGRSAETAGRRGAESGRGWLGLRKHVQGADKDMSLVSRTSLGAGTAIRAIGVAAAGIGVVHILGGFIADARESNKIGALTAQVIKTTGGAAKISAGQVGSLATAISNKTGVDDEAIQSGANLLLTFTSVRNEVGKGNDIFNRATQTVTDMSVALGQDTKSSAIQLGKALNDPIKGVSALQRVGVSFTASQKEQIKTLVTSGNTLGAQKVILGELSKEFGGAAAAASTPMDKLKVSAGNLGEAVGNVLVPYIDKFATFLGQRAVPAVQGFLSGMKDGTGAGGRFAEKVGVVRDKAVAAFGYFKTDVLPVLRSVASMVGAVLVPALGFLSGHLTLVGGVVATLTAAFVAYRAVMVTMAIAQAASRFLQLARAVGVMRAVQLQLNLAMSLNPIGLVVIAVAALVVGFIYAYKHSETFRKIVQTAMLGARVAVTAMVHAAVAAFNWLKGVTASAWGAVRGIVTGVAGAIRTVVVTYFNVYRAIITGVWNAIRWATTTEWNAIRAVVGGAVRGVQATIRGVSAVVGVVRNAFGAARTAAGNALGGLVRTVAGVPDRVIGVFRNAGSWLINAGRDIVGGLIRGVEDMIGSLQSRFSSITNLIPSWKGPASRDASLLRPNAHLIMGGLIGGIAEREGALRSGLGRVTGIVAGTAMPGFGTPTAGALAGMAARQAQGALTAGGGDVHVHLHFDGGVLSDDPRAFAAKAAPHIREALTRDARRNNRDPRL